MSVSVNIDKQADFLLFLSGNWCPEREQRLDSREVKKMNQRQINIHVDRWIEEDDLPVRASLKVIHRNDPDYEMTEDEIEDRKEFIRCYILKDFATLLMIPVQKFGSDFFVEDWEESAFNTEDFYRVYPSSQFNRYAYRIKKVMEKVMDLAILHSCISSSRGRMRTQNRYENLINFEFGNRAATLTKKYRMTTDPEKRFVLRERISELNKRIFECKRIWEQYAPRDT
jgi:hypothetical protein